ncbi:MAG TPA: hypothetical protein GXX46_09520 [Peptococcaceae bacterium]|nr:hypothetical protein [Peptococcaceae bacterium]
MYSSRKEQYLAQKGITAKSRDRVRNVPGDKKLGSLERLLIFLFLIILAAIPLDFLLEQDIMIYVVLINYLIIGLAITIRPAFVVDIMRKRNYRFEEIYGDKLKKLHLVIRGFGLVFIVVGLVIYYYLTIQ